MRGTSLQDQEISNKARTNKSPTLFKRFLLEVKTKTRSHQNKRLTLTIDENVEDSGHSQIQVTEEYDFLREWGSSLRNNF